MAHQQPFQLETYLQAKKVQVEAALGEAVTLEQPASLRQAMEYSLLAEGSGCALFFAWPVANWRVGTPNWLCPRPALWRWCIPCP